jgi:protein required for attachment to host cells
MASVPAVRNPASADALMRDGNDKERRMRIPHDGLVVIADGRKMLFFRNEGDAEFPRLEMIHGEQAANPPDRDQKGDAPGLGLSGAGHGRSAYGEADFHAQESRFATETAGLLNQRALAGEYETLIVVAPPRTLGELRKHYHKEVQMRLKGELAKDLTGHPVDEIERLIVAAE